MHNEHLIEEANRLRADERNRTAARSAADAARAQRMADLGIIPRKLAPKAPVQADRSPEIKTSAKGKGKAAPQSPDTPVESSVVDEDPIIDQTPVEGTASETLTPDE